MTQLWSNFASTSHRGGQNLNTPQESGWSEVSKNALKSWSTTKNDGAISIWKYYIGWYDLANDSEIFHDFGPKPASF